VDVTAAFWNAQVRDAINFLTNVPLFSASAATNTTLTTAGTKYAIALNTVGVDSYAGWNAGTNTYTCVVAGWYLVSGGVTVTLPSTMNYLISGVFYNGSLAAASYTQLQMAGSSGNGWAQPVKAYHQFMNVGDTVQLLAQCGTAGTVATTGSSLELQWVHS
jgi:hypothetical protein